MATEKLVIDASSAVRASITGGWDALQVRELWAPSLIWSECGAGLRQLHYRGETTDSETTAAIANLLAAPINVVDSRELIAEAIALARQLGWAKTYDAEFVVLARRLDAPLLTIDRRLAATARRVIRVFPA